jgi:NAD(P)-dependent dehydrogenase (short-subunit alcohol dehydrogenase family)
LPARLGAILGAGITLDAREQRRMASRQVHATTGAAPTVQVMVMALAELTHRLLPGMIARRYGRIINVASVAGLVPQSAGHPLYGASKSLVIQFSQSIALEGMPHNVYTTALCPGFTYSEFHDVTGMRAQVSRLPSWMWMEPDMAAGLRRRDGRPHRLRERPGEPRHGVSPATSPGRDGRRQAGVATLQRDALTPWRCLLCRAPRQSAGRLLWERRRATGRWPPSRFAST